VERDGLRLREGGIVTADRVIAAPALTGRRVAGIPAHDFGGFVRTGPDGRVEELDRVWAAGDMTTCAIKQGGVAAQQADAAAADIAELAGAPVWRMREPLVVRARLAGGAAPLYLRAELDLDGYGVTSSESSLDEPLWWPDAKVFGRHLTPWLASYPCAGATRSGCTGNPRRGHLRRRLPHEPGRAACVSRCPDRASGQSMIFQ
jgi:sulfide:quinone oxidoreductase